MDIQTYYDSNKFLFEFHYDELKRIVESSGELLEGNCYSYHQTTTEFPALAAKRANLLWFTLHAKKIVEIGFNAGHSAAVMMALTSEDTEFLFFDNGSHKYMRPCFNYVTNVFNKTSNLVIGDSRISIPMYIRDHPECIGSYDVVHVDGGHEQACFFSDISNALLLVKKGGLIIVDDTQESYINEWVDRLIKENILAAVDHLETTGYKHRILAKK
jgi:hypothetical protein